MFPTSAFPPGYFPPGYFPKAGGGKQGVGFRGAGPRREVLEALLRLEAQRQQEARQKHKERLAVVDAVAEELLAERAEQQAEIRRRQLLISQAMYSVLLADL